ncbi:MAG: Hsp20/alpha crystallin family protein [Myxococcota bacterium]|nr:Hsp20/alpha crystallin family protein [Myxococcota bacterium]
MGRRTATGKGAGDPGALGGMLRGLGGLLELLSDLTDQEGGEVTRAGEIGDAKGKVKAVYGFTVRLGDAGRPVVQPFGNVKRNTRGAAVVEEMREPMVDVFDEGDHVLVVAEMPGVEAPDVRVEVKDDVLCLTAAHGERKYRREILLPSPVLSEGSTSSFRDGVFELRLPRSK